jgi:phage gp36-like protein
MAYLVVKEDLNTHLYADIIEEITRGEDEIIQRAISAAIAEVKSYLNRYDLLKLFGDADTDPVFVSDHLKNIVKDVACWHLVKLANPNINLELFRTSYEDAIKFLNLVMRGQADPDGWPYKANDPATDEDESTGVKWSSNPKRIQHF